MSRYIDADVVMEVLERSAKDPRNETAMTSWANAFQELIDLLDDTLIPMATTDVQPVVKGEWIYLGLDVAGDYMYQCSQCKAIIFEPEFLINYDKAQLLGSRFNYCPNCGARMDEKGKENLK